MCEPTTIAAVGLAISAASAGAGLVGQQQQAKAQGQYQARQAEAINKNYVQNLAQLGLQQQQEGAAASQKLMENQREAMKARATMATSAGESGVSGLSVAALSREYKGRELNYASSVQENLKNTQDQIAMNALGLQAGTTGALNQNAQPIAKPDYLGAALKVGGDALGAYGSYLKMTPKVGDVSSVRNPDLKLKGSTGMIGGGV